MKKIPKQVEGPAQTLNPGEKVLGPGVVKRVKREPTGAPPPTEELPFTPSEQTFRRR